MATERYSYGMTDPRGIFGGSGEVKYTYEPDSGVTWMVVRVRHGGWDHKEILYTGLSIETAQGYVKLLNEPEG